MITATTTMMTMMTWYIITNVAMMKTVTTIRFLSSDDKAIYVMIRITKTTKLMMTKDSEWTHLLSTVETKTIINGGDDDDDGGADDYGVVVVMMMVVMVVVMMMMVVVVVVVVVMMVMIIMMMVMMRVW